MCAARPGHDVTALGLTRHLHPEDHRRFRAGDRPDLDIAAVHRHIIGIDLDAGPGDQNQVPAAHLGLDPQRGLGDDRVGEVEPHRAAHRADLHPVGDHPVAVPLGVRAPAVDPDQVLGLRLRYGRARLARHRWQVGGQLRQLPVGAGGQCRLNPLVKLGFGQPPVAGRDPEDLNNPVPVFVRGAQLGHGLIAGAVPRRGDLTSHGHILLAIARCRKLGGLSWLWQSVQCNS